nr:MAG TPA: hypothetical protein [Caudoviricetes sp.]
MSNTLLFDRGVYLLLKKLKYLAIKIYLYINFYFYCSYLKYSLNC